MMHEELKPRGAPHGETPKSPIHRAISKGKVQDAVKQEDTPKEAPPEAPTEPATPDGALHDTEPSHKVAVITGASSGIGKAIALHLASSNYNLLLVARNKEELHKVEQELAKYKVRVIVRECDVTKVVQVHDAIAHAAKAFGRIDVLVNNAGLGVYGELENMRLEDINKQMLTNYFGSVLFIKECLPKLKESKGAIINIASIAGLTGVPRMAAYSASKHAVVGLSESLRYELEATGVSVSCVCPGKVKTNFFKHESFKDVDWAQDESGITSSAVANAVDHAIRERDFLYTVPSSKKFELFLKSILPNFMVGNRMKDV